MCSRRNEAITAIKDSIRKSYGKKGEEIVAKNLQAVDQTLAHLSEVEMPGYASGNGASAQRSPSKRARVCAKCPGRNHGRPRRSRAGQRLA